MNRKTLSRLGLGFFSLVFSGMALASYELNLQTPESSVAKEVYELHTLIMVVCLVIFIVVFGAMFYSLFRHRKSVGHKAEQFHENTTVEVIWTVIPFLILIGMAYPATKVILQMKDTSNSDMTVKVTGYQWKWQYDYLGEGVSFFSTLSTPREQIQNREAKDQHYLLEVDNPLVVPVGKKVKVMITAADVIHSWWVPAFSVKQDAIPGYIRDAWFEADKIGTYRGQCAELCGKDHAFMPIVVKVVSEGDYQAWLASKKQGTVAAASGNGKTYTMAELKEQGEKVFGANCVACHQANGMGIPGTFPALNGSKTVNGPIDEHIKTVLNGRPGTAMTAFGKQLSDLDIAAVVTYQRNSWNNKMGDMAQPAQVAALRTGSSIAASAP